MPLRIVRKSRGAKDTQGHNRCCTRWRGEQPPSSAGCCSFPDLAERRVRSAHPARPWNSDDAYFFALFKFHRVFFGFDVREGSLVTSLRNDIRHSSEVRVDRRGTAPVRALCTASSWPFSKSAKKRPRGIGVWGRAGIVGASPTQGVVEHSHSCKERSRNGPTNAHCVFETTARWLGFFVY